MKKTPRATDQEILYAMMPLSSQGTLEPPQGLNTCWIIVEKMHDLGYQLGLGFDGRSKTYHCWFDDNMPMVDGATPHEAIYGAAKMEILRIEKKLNRRAKQASK